MLTAAEREAWGAVRLCAVPLGVFTGARRQTGAAAAKDPDLARLEARYKGVGAEISRRCSLASSRCAVSPVAASSAP